MATIGYGGFGKVRRVNIGGRDVAQKTIAGNNQGIREIKILKALSNHRNIVKYYGSGYDSMRNIVITMELCDMDLNTYVQRKVNITMKEMKVFMNEIIDAVQYTHSKHIVHRDIKPQNILLKNEGGKYVTKLCDFGVANDLDPGSYLGTYAGTQIYMAPEVHTGRYTYSADVFSLGVLLQELLRCCICDANNIEEIRSLHNLAACMTQEDPHQRMSLTQVKSALNAVKDHSQLARQVVLGTVGGTLVLGLIYLAFRLPIRHR